MKIYIRQFKQELSENISDLLTFCKKEKGLQWFTALFILVLWGIKLADNDVFIDSEIMSLKPYLSNVFFMLALWCLALFLCFCLQSWHGPRSPWDRGLPPRFL